MNRDERHDLQLVDVIVRNKKDYDDGVWDPPESEPDVKRRRTHQQRADDAIVHAAAVLAGERASGRRADHIGQEIVLHCIAADGSPREYVVDSFAPYFTMEIPDGHGTKTPQEARDFLNDLYEFIEEGTRPVMEVELVYRRGFVTAFAPMVRMWKLHLHHSKHIAPLRDHLYMFGATTHEHLHEYSQIYHAWRMLGLEEKYEDRITTNPIIDRLMREVFTEKPRILVESHTNTIDDFFNGLEHAGEVVDRRKPMTQLDTYLKYARFHERHGVTTYESNYTLVHRFCTDTGDIGGFSRISIPGHVPNGGVVDPADIRNHKDRPENFDFDIISFDMETSFDATLPPDMPQEDKAEQPSGKIYQIGIVAKSNGSVKMKRSWLLTCGKACDPVRIRRNQRYAMFDPTVRTDKPKMLNAEYLKWCEQRARDPEDLPEFVEVDGKRFYRDRHNPVLNTRRYPLICRDLKIDPLKPPPTLNYQDREWTLCGYKATGPVYRDLTWYTVTNEERIIDDDHEVETLRFDTELDMMQAFVAILQGNPWLVITGHNICGFDIPYFVGRARFYFGAGRVGDPNRRAGDFKNPLLQWGLGKNKAVRMKKSTMKSKQRGMSDTKDVNIDGRLVYDPLRVFKREYKLRSNRLDYIANTFYADKKVDMPYENITPMAEGTYQPKPGKDWPEGVPLDAGGMNEFLGVYCWWDSVLPHRNIMHQKLLEKDIQKCRIIGVFLYELDGRGTSILVHKRIMGYTHREDIVFPYYRSPPDGLDDIEDEHGKKKKAKKAFSGGLVVKMYRGYYNKPIIVIDFSSLYPSIMRAYNICYSTWVAVQRLAEVMVMHDLEDEDAVFNISWEDAKWEPKPFEEILGHIHKHYKMLPNGTLVDTAAQAAGRPCEVASTDVHQHLVEHHGVRVDHVYTRCERRRVLTPKPFDEIKHLVDKHFNRSPSPIDEHFIKEWAINRHVVVKEDEREAYLQAKGIGRVKGEFDHEYLGKRFWRRPDGLYHPRELKFEGVLPRMEADLLAERNRVKGLMKDAKKAGNATLEVVYDGQQLSVKLVMNGAFGYTGAERGKLFLRAMAASITAWGQELNVACQRRFKEWVAAKFPDEFTGWDDPKLEKSVVYGDSVTPDTPLLLRKDGRLAVRRIDEVAESEWMSTTDGKEYATTSWETWTHKGWQPIKTVVRHKTDKQIWRVTTRAGTVDVTEDHSVFRKGMEEVKPEDLKVGDKLEHVPFDFKDMQVVDPGIDEDEAFLWGAFHADGTAWTPEASISGAASAKKYSWCISKRDESLIRLLQSKTRFQTKVYDVRRSSQVFRLNANRVVKPHALKYREMFYTKDRVKKVPDCMLNAPLNIVEAYLRGFYAGDGGKTRDEYVFCQKGKEGSHGLYVLHRRLGRNLNINTHAYKPNIVWQTESRLDDKHLRHGSRTSVFKVHHVDTKPDYVYDLCAGVQTFVGGVGEMLLRNTDSIMCGIPHHDTVVDANDAQKPICDYINQVFPYPVRICPEKTLFPVMFEAPKKYFGGYHAWTPNGPEPPFTVTQGMQSKRRNDDQLTREMVGTLADICAEHPETALEDCLWYVGTIISDLLQHNWEAIPWKLLTRSSEIKKKAEDFASAIPWHSWCWYKWKHARADAPKLGERIEGLPMVGGPSHHPVHPDVLAAMPKRVDKHGSVKYDITKGMWYFPWWGESADYGGRTPHVDMIVGQIINTAAKVLFPFFLPDYEDVRNRTKKQRTANSKWETVEDGFKSAEEMAQDKVRRILRERYKGQVTKGQSGGSSTMARFFTGEQATHENAHETPEQVWRRTFRPLTWKRPTRVVKSKVQTDIMGFFS